ncbi:MAG: LytTR family DNA-binding domain-containing protein [Balneola sp.]
MINCVIIDDEPFARNLLSDYISKIPYLNLKHSFSSGLLAMETLNKEKIDLLFLDIQMPDISGIEFLKSLKEAPKVIFTTAHAEFALEGYELNILDYLLKPFDFPRFLKAIEKASTFQSTSNNSEQKEPLKYILVKDGHRLIKVALQDILYIKGLKDYVQIVTPNKKIVSLQTLKELSGNLPGDKFSRAHNSYIVGLEHINVVEKNRIVIEGEKIPIGPTFRKLFFDALNKIGV